MTPLPTAAARIGERALTTADAVWTVTSGLPPADTIRRHAQHACTQGRRAVGHFVGAEVTVAEQIAAQLAEMLGRVLVIVTLYVRFRDDPVLTRVQPGHEHSTRAEMESELAAIGGQVGYVGDWLAETALRACLTSAPARPWEPPTPRAPQPGPAGDPLPPWVAGVFCVLAAALLVGLLGLLDSCTAPSETARSAATWSTR